MRTYPLSLVILLIFTCAAQAETFRFKDNLGPPGVSIDQQSKSGFTINFSMPSVTFHELSINGKPMTAISIQGALIGNNEDAPNLPGIGRFFAFPKNAKVQVDLINSRTRLFKKIDIAPAMRIPVENDQSAPIYVEDPLIYTKNKFYPDEPVKISKRGLLRGIDYSMIGITPFQYNPVTKELLVYTDIRLRVSFIGGSGIYGEDRLRSRLFDPILKSHFVNAQSLPDMDYNIGQADGRADEAEYVIITPSDPGFIKWGKVIKDFRTLQGIRTELYTKSVVGQTATEIKNWIHNAVNTWSLPPAAVLILGDTTGLPDKTIPIPYWGSTPSDNIYADVNGDDLPDLVISRITARDIVELERMVMKVIDYENKPPIDPSFYDKPTLAMGWQADRWFGVCTEVVFGFFDRVLGKHPNREYAGFSGPPGVWSSNQNTWMIIDYFGPTGLGYIASTPIHLVNWSGSANKINNDFNNGSFLGLHRGHGGTGGWALPSYQISDLADLNNTMAPYVFSINCQSGAFDSTIECFAEAIHRLKHGAVGVTAATASSFSFVNDAFVWGMMESMWPEFDPGYGGVIGDNILKPCFANVSGKYYLHASNWPHNHDKKEITYHLFHAHCETLFTMCTEVPQALNVIHAANLPLGKSVFEVTADSDANIALTIEDSNKEISIIGTGVGTGMPENINIIPQTVKGIMTVTVTKPNHFRYSSTATIGGSGGFIQYGAGIEGSGQFTPVLSGAGSLVYGTSAKVELSQGKGGAYGLILLGQSAGNIPFAGGTLLTFPVKAAIPTTLSGSPGAPGAGEFSIPFDVNIMGCSVFLQVFLADVGAVKGISMSNGLEIAFP